jgi:hypothetical protein
MAMVYAHARRGIGLWIKIDEQDLVAELGDTRGQIDRRRGLADAALLIRDRYTHLHHLPL